MRIRSIKPEWLDDERLLEAGDVARLMSIMLIVLADDYGNGRAGERWLAGRCFAGDVDSLEKVRGGLRRLAEVGFIDLYTVRKQSYFAILNWSKHQRVDNAGKPHVPGPNEAHSRDSPRLAESRGEPPLDQDQDQDHDLSREAAPPEVAEESSKPFGPLECSQLFELIWRDHWPDHWLQIDTNLGRQRKRTRRILAYATETCVDGDARAACVLAMLAFVEGLDPEKIAAMNDPWAVFAANPGKSLADRRAA